MRYLLAALLSLALFAPAVPAHVDQPLAAWHAIDRRPTNGAVAIQPRIPVVVASPGLPGPGERMQIVWRTTPERMYGLTNQSGQPITWSGYVYSGFHAYLTETASIPLTIGAGQWLGPMGGFSQWTRTLQPGEIYWGPVPGGPNIEGGARDVHTWHLWPWIDGWRFEAPEITLWIEPVVYGAITQGGHASNVHHAVYQEVSLLRLRIVPE